VGWIQSLAAGNEALPSENAGISWLVHTVLAPKGEVPCLEFVSEIFKRVF
jgi:hypothetical protein